MSPIKIYIDYLSQPSRAVLLLVKATGIEHEVVQVSIIKGEQRTEGFKANVNRFGKLPAINDDGFKLAESIAILRYLKRTYDIPDHWYPSESQAQAKVDEFLEWYHIGLRVLLGKFFVLKVVRPLLTGVASDEKEVEAAKKEMEATMDNFEKMWLNDDEDYVVGKEISVADLMALCEIDEIRAAGYDPTLGRPNLRSWLYRVRRDLSPHYDEITGPLKQLIKGQLVSKFQK